MTPELRFIDLSHPTCWLMVADELHQQAKDVYRRVGRAQIAYVNHKEHTEFRWDATNRSAFLLSGFALENSIKAFLVYENPSWISNKTLAKPLRSHSLADLSQKSSLIPYPKRGLKTLVAFESGLNTWARYPCGLTLEETPEMNLLSDELWKQYRKLMAAYGKRLQGLLSQNWKGPHGSGGRMEHTGEPLLV